MSELRPETPATRVSAAAQAPSLSTDALDYELPAELIAERPAEPRDSARMLVLRCSGGAIEHRRARDLPEYLDADDLLVVNDTAVAPARVFGKRADTGGAVEGLFLIALDESRWRMMLKSNGKLRPGQRIELLDAARQTSGHAIELIERDGDDWVVKSEGGATPAEALDAVGWTPLPPYIVRARREREHAFDDALDRRWYQTIYADAAQRHSVAAPTAGLHFTPELLSALEAKGVQRASVTLHVGEGTFKPVSAATLAEHEMHSEWRSVSPETIAALRETKVAKGRVIAVGTTTVRTLESLPAPLSERIEEPIAGDTNLLIAPPYEFRLVDGMLTNFHLPRSTLLALVAAMAGLDRLLSVYREAVLEGYRFYSYGDAMLILP